jgi:hypothetical protein
MRDISRRLFLLVPIVAVLASSQTPSIAQPVSVDCPQRVAAVDFYVDSIVLDAEQRTFKTAFCQMIVSFETWAKNHGWDVPADLQRIKILVGEHYPLARSLVPAWEGDRGRMEFPATRVKNVQADIAHELTHYYFPNANRMMAEGLAVYVQDETSNLLGANPGGAYPNMGIPVHDAIKCFLSAAEIASIDLSVLDKIHTPLALTVDLPQQKPSEQARWSYIIAGSFARYLIEKYGMDQFHALYSKTQFVPGRHIDRTNDDWTAVYGLSLSVLQADWRTMILQLNPTCPP